MADRSKRGRELYPVGSPVRKSGGWMKNVTPPPSGQQNNKPGGLPPKPQGQQNYKPGGLPPKPQGQ